MNDEGELVKEDEEEEDTKTGEVVNLDAFRKK